MAEPGHTRHTFVALDALRGIAAIGVLFFHESVLFRPFFFRSGFLAVDFFFILSGFVLAYAYGSRLASGMPTLAFLKLRVIRLYPLYLLGLVASLIMGYKIPHATPRGHQLLWIAIGLFMIPAEGPLNMGTLSLYPYNPPAWSLFYELVANVAHATLLRYLKTPLLLASMLATVAYLCVVTPSVAGINGGAITGQMGPSLARVAFGYIFGMLLLRIVPRLRPLGTLPFVLAAVGLLAIFSLDVAPQYRLAADLICIAVLLPALLLLAAGSQPRGIVARICVQLGAISYPFYVLHELVAPFFWDQWLRHKPNPADYAPWSGMLLLAFTALIAVLVNRVYDLPVRTWITRWRTRRAALQAGRPSTDLNKPLATLLPPT